QLEVGAGEPRNRTTVARDEHLEAHALRTRTEHLQLVRRLIGACGGRVSRYIARYIGEPGAIHGPTDTAALRYIAREESGQEHDPEWAQASEAHRVDSPDVSESLEPTLARSAPPLSDTSARSSGSSFQNAREGSGVQ